MEHEKTLVVLATKWGPQHGGINSLNADLCRAIADFAGVRVVCVVLSASPAEKDEAAGAKVLLLPLDSSSSRFDELFAMEVVARVHGHVAAVDWWLGHDAVTGAAALKARERGGGKCALMHHMNYLAYKTVEGASATTTAEYKALQSRLLARADVVLAVGPKLHDSARDLLQGVASNVPVHEFIPGLPKKIEPIAAPRQFKLIYSGRLGGKPGRVKQVSLAVAAFSHAVQKFGDVLGDDPVLTLLGADSTPDATKALHDLAQKYADRNVRILDLPYENDRKKFFAQLAEQSAAAMLSVHEGFGLVAWEAIGAEVPLILSKNSGVYRFLERQFGVSATGLVRAVDVKASMDAAEPAQQDVVAVAEALREIARNPAGARRDAHALHEMLVDYTWEAAAVGVLKALDEHAEPGVAAARAKLPTVEVLVGEAGFSGTSAFAAVGCVVVHGTL